VCKGRQLEVKRKTIVIAMPMEMKMLISIPVKTNAAWAKEVNFKLYKPVDDFINGRILMKR